MTNNCGACEWHRCNEVAKKGQLIHSAAADYGENIYCCTDCKKFNGSMAAQAWYNEIEHYDFEKSVFSIETGHFTQLVWKDSVNLGVGYKKVTFKFSMKWATTCEGRKPILTFLNVL
ncbi:hypothetical protein GQX74_001646 [Glossina fuscipes]|nr:hypothetical protein GQX74_001646 [Glossina fuscipes]